jgi:hypothetical protein
MAAFKGKGKSGDASEMGNKPSKTRRQFNAPPEHIFHSKKADGINNSPFQICKLLVGVGFGLPGFYYPGIAGHRIE